MVHLFRSRVVADDSNPLLQLAELFMHFHGSDGERPANDFQHVPQFLASDAKLVSSFERLQASLPKRYQRSPLFPRPLRPPLPQPFLRTVNAPPQPTLPFDEHLAEYA